MEGDGYMGIVYQKNKQTGIIYAYESVSHWDKVKKQSRATRKCIGKIDPETGKIVPSRKSKAKIKAEADSVPAKKGPANDVRHSYYGATYLFDEIGKNLGIIDDLKHCFPKNYKKTLSAAYYLILEDRNPYRFPKWSKTHKHPYRRDITSQRSSELFESITEQEREDFFRLQGKRRSENEYWVYDISTFSTWSECLKQAKYGQNKENERLEQINMALLFSEQSGFRSITESSLETYRM